MVEIVCFQCTSWIISRLGINHVGGIDLGINHCRSNHVALYCVINCFSRFFSSNNCWFTFFFFKIYLDMRLQKGLNLRAKNCCQPRQKLKKTKKWDENFHSVWKWPKKVSFLHFLRTNHFGSFLNHFEPFWIILNHFESFWIILNHFESFWIVLNRFESFWIILNHFWIIMNQF